VTEAAHFLVDMALQHGSIDNISVMVIALEDGSRCGGRCAFHPAGVTEAQLADVKFKAAYESDCALHGTTLEQALQAVKCHQGVLSKRARQRIKSDRAPVLHVKRLSQGGHAGGVQIARTSGAQRIEGIKFVARCISQGAQRRVVCQHLLDIFNACSRVDDQTLERHDDDDNPAAELINQTTRKAFCMQELFRKFNTGELDAIALEQQLKLLVPCQHHHSVTALCSTSSSSS
jgi:hypothetical protein